MSTENDVPCSFVVTVSDLREMKSKQDQRIHGCGSICWQYLFIVRPSWARKGGRLCVKAIEHTGTWSPHVAPMTLLYSIINMYIWSQMSV